MKVKELIAKLANYDPDLDVLLSRDEEGNGFKKAIFVDRYASDSEFEELYDIDDRDCPSAEGAVEVVVIWP